ncbi:hypothetical protein [Streptacidiphilus sp. EB129]|jgi:hypothetical protein
MVRVTNTDPRTADPCPGRSPKPSEQGDLTQAVADQLAQHPAAITWETLV